MIDSAITALAVKLILLLPHPSFSDGCRRVIKGCQFVDINTFFSIKCIDS